MIFSKEKPSPENIQLIKNYLDIHEKNTINFSYSINDNFNNYK